MKKTLLFATLCSLCFVSANLNPAQAQPGSAEATVKSQTQSFSEGDVFFNVDSDADYKSAAFTAADPDGAVKCWRWYYRPIYRHYYWRPAYYRPYYCYYRYWCSPFYAHFTWSTITVYKGGEGQGAMLDTDPTPNSPLAAKGLRKGDIVTAVDGQPLRNLNDLSRATASSELTVHKGDTVKFAGNLLKNADNEYMKSFDGLQEVESGTLLAKSEIRSGNYTMYQLYEKNAGPVFGVKAADNATNGVKVTEVVAGLPGEKSGFKVGDVILEINGTKITNEKEYSDAIDAAGKTVRMKVFRGETSQTSDVDVILNK